MLWLHRWVVVVVMVVVMVVLMMIVMVVVIDARSVCTDCSADVAAFRRVAGSEAEAASSHD
jgi:hypothetical protein